MTVAAEAGAAAGLAATIPSSPLGGIMAAVAVGTTAYKLTNAITEPVAHVVENACHDLFHTVPSPQISTEQFLPDVVEALKIANSKKIFPTNMSGTVNNALALASISTPVVQPFSDYVQQALNIAQVSGLKETSTYYTDSVNHALALASISTSASQSLNLSNVVLDALNTASNQVSTPLLSSDVQRALRLAREPNQSANNPAPSSSSSKTEAEKSLSSVSTGQTASIQKQQPNNERSKTTAQKVPQTKVKKRQYVPNYNGLSSISVHQRIGYDKRLAESKAASDRTQSMANKSGSDLNKRTNEMINQANLRAKQNDDLRKQSNDRYSRYQQAKANEQTFRGSSASHLMFSHEGLDCMNATISVRGPSGVSSGTDRYCRPVGSNTGYVYYDNYSSWSARYKSNFK